MKVFQNPDYLQMGLLNNPWRSKMTEKIKKNENGEPNESFPFTLKRHTWKEFPKV